MLKLYSIFLCALHISTMFQRVLKSSKLKKFTCFESWTFRKMNIFFMNLYNLFFLHVLQLRATHFIFSSIFWSAKWKNSENYFLNSKKNKTKQANVQYTWIEIVVDNRNKFHVVSLFNSKKFWGRQRKEEIYRIFDSNIRFNSLARSRWQPPVKYNHRSIHGRHSRVFIVVTVPNEDPIDDWLSNNTSEEKTDALSSLSFFPPSSSLQGRKLGSGEISPVLRSY